MHKKYASYIQLHLGTFYFSKPREFDFVQKNIFRKVQKWEELFGKLVLDEIRRSSQPNFFEI